MRVLYIAEFDPCCYGLRLRDRLRALGFDCRIAVRHVYWEEGLGADWIVGPPHSHSFSVKAGAPIELRRFAHDADVVIACPAIGQPWSYTAPYKHRLGSDIEAEDWHGIHWPSVKRRVALFHGSKSLQRHAEAYAAHYREQGWDIAATTLDYVDRMGARYFPAIVDVGSLRAEERADAEGLVVVHTPTDPSVCHTAELVKTCAEIGIPARSRSHEREHELVIARGMSHQACLRLKRTGHVGFDHLRGSFSINALEFAALGLVPLVGVTDRALNLLEQTTGARPPWPRIVTLGDLASVLATLRDSPAKTRAYQGLAADWFAREWHPMRLASHIAEQLRA